MMAGLGAVACDANVNPEQCVGFVETLAARGLLARSGCAVVLTFKDFAGGHGRAARTALAKVRAFVLFRTCLVQCGPCVVVVCNCFFGSCVVVPAIAMAWALLFHCRGVATASICCVYFFCCIQIACVLWD